MQRPSPGAGDAADPATPPVPDPFAELRAPVERRHVAMDAIIKPWPKRGQQTADATETCSPDP